MGAYWFDTINLPTFTLHSEDPGSFVELHRKPESLPHSMHDNATITKRCTIKIKVKNQHSAEFKAQTLFYFI